MYDNIVDIIILIAGVTTIVAWLIGLEWIVV